MELPAVAHWHQWPYSGSYYVPGRSATGALGLGGGLANPLMPFQVLVTRSSAQSAGCHAMNSALSGQRLLVRGAGPCRCSRVSSRLIPSHPGCWPCLQALSRAVGPPGSCGGRSGRADAPAAALCRGESLSICIHGCLTRWSSGLTGRRQGHAVCTCCAMPAVTGPQGSVCLCMRIKLIGSAAPGCWLQDALEPHISKVYCAALLNACSWLVARKPLASRAGPSPGRPRAVYERKSCCTRTP